MIITEIKVKHLKVRISEFEDLIFDKNILPIFTTSSILKEVEARKTSKFKIETLNPQRKLTFKVVSFNEIVEELATKINKIAINLEPFYFTDPSDFNSLPYNVKEILYKDKLIEDKKNIDEAKKRIKRSTIKKKKLILFAKHYIKKNRPSGKNIRKKWKGSSKNVKKTMDIGLHLFNKINKKNIKPIFNINNIFKYRFLNFKYINLFNKNKNINNLILYSGLIPTSKGALMLLEDNGWDLDLLSNRNRISQKIRKLRPFKLKRIRRLRRLRRLRLISTNLFLHRSKNVEKIIKDQENQGRNLSTLKLLNQSTLNYPNPEIINNINLSIKHSLSSTIRIRRDAKLNNINISKVDLNIINSVNNNNFFFKHTDNKLKFIINWIGKNLKNYKENPLLSQKGDRLEFKNINDIFLIMQDKPTQILLIEDKEFSNKNFTQQIIIENKQAKLDQIILFKENRAKKIEEAENLIKKKKYKKKFSFKNRWKKKLILKKRYRIRGLLFFKKKWKLNLRKKPKLKLKFKWKKKKFFRSKFKFKSRFKNINILKKKKNFFNINKMRNISKFSIFRYPQLNSPLNNWRRALSTYSYNNIKYKNRLKKYNGTKNVNLLNNINILNYYLKNLNYKIKIWEKKQKLSKNLLNEISLRYLKTFMTNSNFSVISNELLKTKKISLIDNLNEKKFLKKYLYLNILNKLNTINDIDGWKKIASLFNNNSKSNSILFWTIIKLYSSSFNPLFSLFNNKFNDILGQSSSKIKILKIENDSLNTISSNTKEMVTKNLNNKEEKKIFNNSNHIKLTIAKKLKIKTNNIKGDNLSVNEPSNNYNLSNKFTPADHLNFNSLALKLFPIRSPEKSSVSLTNKKNQFKLQPKPLQNFKDLTKKTETNLKKNLRLQEKITITNNKLKNKIINNGVKKKILNNKINNIKQLNLKVNKDYKHNYFKIWQANKKRFLFLYFLLPIFFSILKNYNSVSVKQNNLKFLIQINQIRSLIKLMLVSGSSIMVKKNFKHNVDNVNLLNYNKFTSLLAYKSSYQTLLNPIKSINNKNKLIDYNKSTKNSFINNYSFNNKNLSWPSGKNFNKVKLSTDLFKWAILFIAQSLAPLKKDNFHILILLNLLETKGYINFDHFFFKNYKKDKTVLNYLLNSVNNSILLSEFDKTNSNIISENNKIKTSESLAISDPFNKQEKTNLSINDNSDDFSNSLEEDKKKYIITYFPGGRQISNWKKITSAIWQEEYKFNLYYKREKLSLNLALKNANKKISIFYTIITLFKLWDAIKITSIKSIASLKLQALYLNKTNKIVQTNNNLNNYFDVLKLYIIDFIFNNINKFNKIKTINFNLFTNKPKDLNIFKTIFNNFFDTNKLQDKVEILKKNNLIKNKLSYKLLNNSNYSVEIKKNLLNSYNSYFNNYFVLENLNKFLVFHNKLSSTNFKLTLIINHINKNLPLVLSSKNKLIKKNNLNFISNNIYLSEVLNQSLFNYLWNDIILDKNKFNNNIFSTNKFKLIKNNYNQLEQQAIPIRLTQDLAIKTSFNNLVNAKSTVIGKIRSIKLLELIDQLKEEIALAEKLAALVRVADITELKFNNIKKKRKINSFYYLNKKKISKSNRIKILQTINSIKSDFIFEQKLDSNSGSNLPISLLYYSNLKPIHKLNHKLNFNNQVSIININKNSKDVINNPVLSAYLRELSIYNRETKGIINFYSKIVGYNFNYNSNKISSSIYDLLAAAFFRMRCLISKPIFIFTPDKISIHLFYYLMVANKKTLKIIRRKLFFFNRKRRSGKGFNNKKIFRINKTYNRKRLRLAKNFNLKSLNDIFPDRLFLLCSILNKIFNKPVELNLTRLHYPSADSNILVNFMGIIINKVKLPRIFKALFAGSIIKTLIKIKSRKFNDISIIPAFLTGLSIKVAGRIMTQNIKPRKTINFRRRGVTASGKINYLNFARLTNKNKRGSYSITISAGQNYFK